MRCLTQTQTRMSAVTRLDVLAVLGDFDRAGGASLNLLAWELVRSPELVASTWDAAEAEGLIRAVGADPRTGELIFRLTAGGWEEVRRTDLGALGELRFLDDGR
jgi:hypothetical protein